VPFTYSLPFCTDPQMVVDVPKKEDVPQRLTNQRKNSPMKGKIWMIS
jgi:hypothetical protein